MTCISDPSIPVLTGPSVHIAFLNTTKKTSLKKFRWNQMLIRYSALSNEAPASICFRRLALEYRSMWSGKSWFSLWHCFALARDCHLFCFYCSLFFFYLSLTDVSLKRYISACIRWNHVVSTLIQRHWRWINVATTLFQCCLPAGVI